MFQKLLKPLIFALSIGVISIWLFAYYHNINTKTLLYWWQDWTQTSISETLFIGSSTIDRLPVELLEECSSPSVYGFDNGTTESVQTYLMGANLKRFSKIILYIGENDIAQGKSVTQTFENLQTLIGDMAHKSRRQIGIMTIKYSPIRSRFHVDFLEFNRALEKRYGEVVNGHEKKARLIPFDKTVRTNDFLGDGVHLNPQGYKKLSKIINQFCSEST